MSKPRRLEGKVAIITGAASGIGEATAKVFVENGAFVVVADIQEELGLKVVASIGGPDHKAIYKKCDVTVEKQVEETVAFAIEKYGTLDIMYSNAGIMGPIESILDMDMEEVFDRTMAVNLKGSAICIKQAAQAMVKRKIRGSIICTGSVASVLGGMGPHAYTASKHGLVGVVRGAASELGRHGIRVNCVSPSGVVTPLVMSEMLAMGINDASAVEEQICSAANLKGISLNPKHVAEVALFLASDESIFVSGHNLAVDGGFSVVNNSLAMMMQMQTKQLEGKVAIITGAASGIGEAIAKVVVENGAFVVVADIQEELGLKVVASIGGPDHKAIYKKCNVTVEKQVEEIVAFAIEKYGTLDIMYSNAGIMGLIESILDMDTEEGFDRTMAVNLKGSAICIKQAAQVMVKRKIRESIICTGSVASVLGGMDPHAYTASKHGLVGLVRGVASELGRHGIRVNCVSPSGVVTALVISEMSVMGIKDASAVEERICSAANLKGISLNPKHVAEVALFLASDESIFVRGHNLDVDGGFSVVNNSLAMMMQMQTKQ